MTPSGLLFAIISLAVAAAPAWSGFPDFSYGSSLPASSVTPSPLLRHTPFRGKTTILKAQAAPQYNPLQELFSWNALEYNLPAYAPYEIDAYSPVGSIFTGLEFTHDRFFIAVPRLYPGVPSTLNYIPRNAVGAVQNPKLEPFPSAEWTSPVGQDGEQSSEWYKLMNHNFSTSQYILPNNLFWKELIMSLRKGYFARGVVRPNATRTGSVKNTCFFSENFS